jgi:CheY-like chemotaxis protein
MEGRMLNILLVDDDEVDVMNVRRAFRKANISSSLHVASNGLEALEILRGSSTQQPPLPIDRRLVVLDLNMPKMGGIEFLRELRADPRLKATPVVVLTTSNVDQDRFNAYDLNIAGYLLKPVTFANFVEIMETVNRYWAFCEMP